MKKLFLAKLLAFQLVTSLAAAGSKDQVSPKPELLPFGSDSLTNLGMLLASPTVSVRAGQGGAYFNPDRTIIDNYGKPENARVFSDGDCQKIYRHFTSKPEYLAAIIQNAQLIAGGLAYVSANSACAGMYYRETYVDCRGVFFTDTTAKPHDVGVPSSIYYVDFKFASLPVAALELRSNNSTAGIYLVPLLPGTPVAIEVVGHNLPE